MKGLNNGNTAYTIIKLKPGDTVPYINWWDVLLSRWLQQAYTQNEHHCS